MTTGHTTLITGATSGIGLHLTHEFATHGHPLILVAPVQAELESVAQELRVKHGVDVDVIACDLQDAGAIDDLLRRLEDSTVDILVNNAGLGQRGRFWEIPLDTHLAIVQVNIEAVLRLTSALLPAMVQRGRGGVLTTASVAGFEPGPNLAVYHASKAFVLSWSEALATELEDTGVTATALCPGPTDTDFFAKADMENTRAFQQANLMAPQDVAKIGYKAFMDKERVVVAGGINKAAMAARRLMPESLQAAKNEKFYEEVPPEDRKRVRGDKEMRQGNGHAA
jgi:short-subunit dehydrogenase